MDLEIQHLHPKLEEIKKLTKELSNIQNEKENMSQQINHYQSTVATYMNRMKRAESLLQIDLDPEISVLTESTNQKIKTMETQIQNYYMHHQALSDKYDQCFEKRKNIVHNVLNEMNQHVEYFYPFGNERPTIRMAKYYNITNDGDLICEMRFESNSFFNENFHQI